MDKDEQAPAAADASAPDQPVRYRPSRIRVILAAVMDFFTVYFLFGFLIAVATGATREGGFKLEGLPAIACMVLIGAYFLVGHYYLGGTLWQRILKAR